MSMGMDLPPDKGHMGGEMQDRLMEEAEQARQVEQVEQAQEHAAAEEGKTIPERPWWKFWG